MSVTVKDPSPQEQLVGDGGRLTLDGVKLLQELARAIRELQGGSFDGDSITIATTKTPASAADTGTTGQIAWDSDYLYVCVAADTWKRTALSTW